MMNQCIGLSQNIENLEVINLENHSNEFHKWSLDRKSKITTNKLCLIKLNIKTDLIYCKHCNQLHLKNTDNNSTCSTTENLTNIFNINNLLFTSLLNNGFKQNEIYFTIKQRKMQVRKKQESAQNTLNHFKDCIYNGDKIIKQYCDRVRKQIKFNHEQKIDQLIDYRNQTLKDLNEIEQRCLRSVDFQGNQWTSFKQFYLNEINLINLFDLNLVLEHELNDEINTFIKSKQTLLEEKKQQLDSYLLMNKTIEFLPLYSSKIINESLNQIGILNQVEICSNNNNNNSIDIEQYIRLNDSIFSNQIINKWNSQLIDESFIEKHKNNLLTINTVDTNVLICNRYNIEDEIQSSLIMFDCFNNLVKKLNFEKSIIRCVSTNSNYILTTIEQLDDNNKLLDSFNLNLYDLKLDLIKSITIETTSPVALYIDQDKCYLFTNKSPVISVFNFNLQLITRFGQNKTEKEVFYFKNKPDYFMIKNFKCYTSEKKQLSKETYFTIHDLTSGVCLKEINLNYVFNKFYVYPNDSLVFMSENHSFVCYDFKNKIVKQKADLVNETSMYSYDINKLGFVVCLAIDNSVVVF